jgi:hypothetical protein
LALGLTKRKFSLKFSAKSCKQKLSVYKQAGDRPESSGGYSVDQKKSIAPPQKIFKLFLPLEAPPQL